MGEDSPARLIDSQKRGRVLGEFNASMLAYPGRTMKR
jgi:hypothetical protein